MTTFIVDLWQSILTPGPTPALVKAANASFAALLVVLVFLLVSTRNLHFAALSVLASGLWAAINWFVRELEVEKKRQQGKTSTTDSTRSQNTSKHRQKHKKNKKARRRNRKT